MENLKEIYNRLAKNWGSHESSWGHTGLEKFVKKAQKGKVLDLGCGSGFQSKYLVEAGLKVVGIDFSEGMIDECKKRVPEASFLVMDMLNLEFPDSEFDGVYSRASLSHLAKKDLSKVLSKLNKILKKNGIFYIAVKEDEGERYVDHPEKGTRFFSFYKENELKKYLENAGFKVEEIFYEKVGDTSWLQVLGKKNARTTRS